MIRWSLVNVDNSVMGELSSISFLLRQQRVQFFIEQLFALCWSETANNIRVAIYLLFCQRIFQTNNAHSQELDGAQVFGGQIHPGVVA